MAKKFILFDLPSNGHCRSWSLNPWKARAVFNFKGVDYTTEWIEYPDIAPKCKQVGIQPTPPGSLYEYGIPIAKFPDGSHIMDSLKIAQRIEEVQPEPSLHLDSDYVDRTQKTVLAIMAALAPINMPRVPGILPERSAEYFHETRAKRFGMPLPEFAKCDRAGETAWKNAEPSIQELSTLLHEHEDGPFVAGKEVSFADFILGGFWRFLEILGKDDIFGRLMSHDEAFVAQWEAVKKYFERDDY